MELLGIDLGDQRLNQRSVRVLEALAAKPESSINAACDGWSDTLAADRLFDNAAVEPEKILAPHVQATQERIKQHPIVLMLQTPRNLTSVATLQKTRAAWTSIALACSITPT